MRGFSFIPISTWAAFALLAGCSQAPDGAATSDASAPAAEAAKAGANGADPLAVTLPRIAYVYRLGFQLPGDDIARVQAAHVGLCDRLGPARCQLVAMTRAGGDSRYATGELKLRVASGIARSFARALESTVAGAGGRAIDSAIEAEDVSKAMVDAEARIRQRGLLVERLTEVLRRRDGKVGELVEAERGVAAAQEELDQARAWLAELRGRVAMSTFEIGYNAAAPAGGGPVGEAVAESAALFTTSLAALLRVLILLAPWALVAAPVWWLVRRWRRRRAAPVPEG